MLLPSAAAHTFWQQFISSTNKLQLSILFHHSKLLLETDPGQHRVASLLPPTTASPGRASAEVPEWQRPGPSPAGAGGKLRRAGGRDPDTPLRTDPVDEKVHSLRIHLFCTLVNAHQAAQNGTSFFHGLLTVTPCPWTSSSICRHLLVCCCWQLLGLTVRKYPYVPVVIKTGSSTLKNFHTVLTPRATLGVAGRGLKGAPVLSQGLQPEQERQLWNEIDDACSAWLSLDSQPQASNALEELCITIMGTLPKPQETDEKDNTKRFLFHYSKTRKLGNSNVVSSVVHPLLQLVPQLHERRMKRFRLDEEFQGPIASQVRRQFLFRPRNGRRSEGYI
ncbi:neuromedin-U [Neovison vison]|nr:neuromedin-U [Neogale vison]